MVEKEIMKAGAFDIAKKYITRDAPKERLL